MIEIEIKVNGEEVADSVNYDNLTLQQTALAVYRLESIKKDLLKKKFESKWEVREGDEEDKE